MKRAWRFWVALFDRREPGDTLALMRILTGIGAFWFLATMIHAGVVDLLYLPPAHGGYLPIASDWWLVRLLGGVTPEVVHSLVATALGSAILVTLGLGGPLAPLCCAQALLALKSLNGLQGSYAAVTSNALWLLVLARSTRTLSLDCWLRTGRFTSDAPVPIWPKHLAIAQLAIIYFSSGLSKISAHWTPGGDMSALYYVLQQPTWQRGDMSWLAHVYPLTQLGTLLTWLFELSWPVMIVAFYVRATKGPEPPKRAGFTRRLFTRFDPRKIYVPLGIALHLGIALALDVGPFLVATLALYPCLFTSSELRAAVTTLSSRLRARGQRPAAQL